MRLGGSGAGGGVFDIHQTKIFNIINFQMYANMNTNIRIKTRV